jgi:hypothetical protein
MAAKVVLTVVGQSVQVIVADESSKQSRFISGAGCCKLHQGKGKSILIRDHIAEDNPNKYKPRAAQIGSYDGKGTLTIGTGHPGKPILSVDDLAAKETFVVDPKLFDALCIAFDATISDADAVQAITDAARAETRKAKKTAVVEAAVKL